MELPENIDLGDLDDQNDQPEEKEVGGTEESRKEENVQDQPPK